MPGFDSLITLNANTIKELPHQIDVALRVLRQMGGRALLADEVGLGKTIEAGIVLKELAVRGLAKRVLILTPAALVDQWQGELESKFFERFETPTEPDEWHRLTRGIASYDRARSKRHRDAILKHSWDVVILDEAHKVKDHTRVTYKFIAQIRRNFILLLTATPLQNDLRELYNLVTLLRPGQLGTWNEFSRRYLMEGDRRRVKDPAALRELTSQVMVRTRRASVAHSLELPKRVPSHPKLRLTPGEAQLYSATVGYLRRLYKEGFIRPTDEEEEEDRARRKRRTGKGILSLEQEQLNSEIAGDDNALRLEREFAHLPVPMRVRLGYGTKHLEKVEGIDARRELLGLHVSEIMEALEGADARDAERSREYGHLVQLSGVTYRGRAVHLKVKAERLPMLLVELDADPEAPLVRPAA